VCNEIIYRIHGETIKIINLICLRYRPPGLILRNTALFPKIVLLYFAGLPLSYRSPILSYTV